MQSIIASAISNTAVSGQSDASDEYESFGEPKIVIVGCGGAGNNTVNRLHKMGVRGAETVAINTDKIHLDIIEADKKLLIGRSITRGLGAGGAPEVAERAAEMAQAALEDLLDGADMVFVTAGMGGGTGTGSAPVVAKVAKKKGAIVVGMVSTPFNVERARLVKGEEGLNKLRKECDTVIVLDNNRLLKYVPNLPLEQAFAVMDTLIAETVKGISETITTPSLINLDFADIRTIMNCGGVAVMLYGEAKSTDPNKVVAEALNHPLLDIDYRGATGALVHMTGGPDLSLQAAEGVAQALTYELDSRANVIWGARILPEFEGKMRVLAIMTGIQSAHVIGPAPGSQTVGRRINSQDSHAAPVASAPSRGAERPNNGFKNLDLPWVG
ncbi:MAG TPA: cell division protein FtsZ [Candidatus Thermoplasmatota archaeon]|nr:cell division protein FtsZ [Candidatus Thermoplasmatota archaeon]